MKQFSLILTLILAACAGTPTGPSGAPSGIDPTVRVTNRIADTAWVAWWDQRTGLLQTLAAPPGLSCVRFTVPDTDSIKVEVWASANGGDTLSNPWGFAYSPWFLVGQPFTIASGIDVSDFWTATVDPSQSFQGPPSVQLAADSTAPC